jgi:hypothetical protein
MATIDYSPEEQAYIQERDAASKQQVATAPEPKAVTKKTITVKDTNPSTLATVSDVQDTNAAPVDYGSLVSNVVSGYKDVKEKAPSVLESLDTSMPWLKYAAGALGILGAGTLAYKAGGGGRPPNPPDDNNNGGRKSPSSIKDRSMIRIDPEMDVSRRMPDGRIEPTFGGTDGNRMVGGLFPADVSTKPTGPTPENPTVDLNTKINNKPNNFNLVEESEQNKLKNETANARKQGVNPLAGATELRTGTGKPAFEGANPEGKIKSSYPDIKSVPKGYAFIPDARYIDVLRNDLGQAEYTKNLTGRPFPKEYLGPAGAVEVGKEINRSLGRETRAELLAKGIPESQLPKPTPGILEKTNAKGNKTVAVGGIIGALTALPNLANAAQGAGEKDIQKTFGSFVEGVGQFLGPLGAIYSGIGGISPEELETLRKSKQSPKIGVPPPR